MGFELPRPDTSRGALVAASPPGPTQVAVTLTAPCPFRITRRPVVGLMLATAVPTGLLALKVQVAPGTTLPPASRGTALNWSVVPGSRKPVNPGPIRLTEATRFTCAGGGGGAARGGSGVTVSVIPCGGTGVSIDFGS